MKRLVERPLTVIRGGIRETFVVKVEEIPTVDLAADLSGRPFDGIHIELTTRRRTLYRRCLLRVDGVIVSTGMHARVHHIRIEPHVFHDVDLAALRPTAVSPAR